MAVDIQRLEKAYFYFDKPVPYITQAKQQVNIAPISMVDSEVFIASSDILQIDKNSLPEVEIIKMSYLDFIFKVIAQQDAVSIDKMINILRLCLGITNPFICIDDKERLYLKDGDTGVEIHGKDFDDIKRIILYQNLIHYDDAYLDPEIKKSMQEVDRIKNMGINPPNTERRMSIITAHCGVLKKDQLAMTMRSHQSLFEEVVGEVEFTTVRPIALFGNKSNELEHWIYHKKKGKYDGYTTSVTDFNKSMGGDGTILSSTADNLNIDVDLSNFL